MQSVILVIQILCVALLAAGTGFSVLHLLRTKGGGEERFSYAAANDFETDFRRLARNNR